MKACLYHNPRCSKSRQALNVLRDHKLELTVIEYLKQPLHRDELQQLMRFLAIEDVRQMMRSNETLYQQKNLAAAQLSTSELLTLIIAEPILLQRPIVVLDAKKALIARPPEKLLEYLS